MDTPKIYDWKTYIFPDFLDPLVWYERTSGKGTVAQINSCTIRLNKMHWNINCNILKLCIYICGPDSQRLLDPVKNAPCIWISQHQAKRLITEDCCYALAWQGALSCWDVSLHLHWHPLTTNYIIQYLRKYVTCHYHKTYFATCLFRSCWHWGASVISSTFSKTFSQEPCL